MEVGTLTRFPPLHLRFISNVVRLPLLMSLPWRHENEGNVSFLLHARGLAVASFSWHSEARADELAAEEQTKSGSVLNLDLLEQLDKQRQWQYGK